MKANKRIRDLRRRSNTRLVYWSREFRKWVGTTTFPAESNGVKRVHREA
jgi:hypothetical protein